MPSKTITLVNKESLDVIFGPGESVNKAKARVVQKGMANVVQLLKAMPELMELTVFGVDVVTVSPPDALRQRGYEMVFYPKGPLGVIEEGAYADLLIVDGNPLEDITILGASPEQYTAPDRKAGEIKTMRLVMKDGVIYKNTLPE